MEMWQRYALSQPIRSGHTIIRKLHFLPAILSEQSPTGLSLEGLHVVLVCHGLLLSLHELERHLHLT